MMNKCIRASDKLNGQMANRSATACAVMALSLVSSCCCSRPVPSFVGTPIYVPSGHFAVIGDLHRTLPEGEIIGNEDNTHERTLLLPEIARTNPAFIVMLGDLVSWGASTNEWAEFDQRATTVRQKGIPVFAVPGNHDYYGGEKLRQYFARLPHLHNQRWYSQQYGPLKMIFASSRESVGEPIGLG